MEQEQSEYDFEPFAATEEYKNVNRTIVERWVDALTRSREPPIDRIIDVATGVGTMVQLFLDLLPAGWRQPSVICVDRDANALEQARERLAPKVKNIELVCTSAENMDLPAQSVDVVVWGNGIHYLDPDAQQVALENIRRCLRPGGWFFFNSAFCEESRPAETLPFYRAQIRKAVTYLRSRGILREDRQARPPAGSFLPESHYRGLLQRLGFSIEEMSDVEARIHRTALEHISAFRQYAAGALHGYRPEAASEAMRASTHEALEEQGFRDEQNELYVPRNWLEVIARRLSPAQA